MTIAKFEVPDWVRSVLICDPTDIWGNVVGMGLAELSAVLSPAKRFDRRGNTIFIDSFESGLKAWYLSGSGTNNLQELSTTASQHGGFSLKLTAGSDGSRYADAVHASDYPILGKSGIEIHFTIEAPTEYFEVRLELYDGVTYHEAAIRYDQDNSKVQYLNSAGVWTNLITDVSLAIGAYIFHVVKLVVDFNTNKYVRVLFNKWSWVTGDLSIYTEDSGASRQFLQRARHYGASALNAVSYIDSVIITQNEPA